MSLQKAGALFGILLPVLAGVWWAGSGYVEFSDRLTALENLTEELHNFQKAQTVSQVRDDLINERVAYIDGEIEWLKYHHHHDNGEGRPHTD